MVKISILVLIGLFFIGCDDDNENANASIVGSWKVEKSQIVDQAENDTIVVDAGSFAFTESTVVYDFLVGEQSYTGENSYILTTEMVNSGFIKVPKYTLDIADFMKFNVEFGDMTSGAEKNATSIRLSEIKEVNTPYIYLELEKE